MAKAKWQRLNGKGWNDSGWQGNNLQGKKSAVRVLPQRTACN
jgi:hypothetical protein